MAFMVQLCLSGTVVQLAAVLTKANAFISPEPNLVLNHSPAAFFCQPGLLATGAGSEVQTIRCCVSLHVKSGLKVVLFKCWFWAAMGWVLLYFQCKGDNSSC